MPPAEKVYLVVRADLPPANKPCKQLTLFRS